MNFLLIKNLDFFAFVFALAAIYFYNAITGSLTNAFGLASLIFLFITLVKADVLLPLNKLWMRLGLIIGMVVCPIVLGLIFFLLFTPIALVMRLFGHDELRLKLSKKPSHWKSYSEQSQSNLFKNQF
ncbi:SxtJ family membrane protein [Paracoccaceae bacterium]|nr:SxtJ family membrane protein [Paracoccaceae bacterium]